MITKLPEWYRIQSLSNVTEETLEKRSKTIAKIVKKKDINFLLNCVKLFLNKPVSNPDFASDLTKFFLEDPLFPQTNNNLKLRVLAGAIIAESIETSKTNERFQIALALRVGLFQHPSSELINVDIIGLVQDFLHKEAVNKRTIIKDVVIPEFSFENSLPDNTVENITLNFERLKDALSDVSISLKQVFDYSKNNISILQEESNIHWWIFRSYSNLSKCSIIDLDYHAAPIIIGKELGDLTCILPGVINSDQFLKKVIFDNFKKNKTKISLKDAINKMDKEIRKMFQIDISNPVISLCPLYLASSLSLQVDDENGWTALFEKSTGIKVSSEIDPIDLALQCYNESLLLKTI